MISQRDVFLNKLFNIAKNDKDVILISVDMGASSLDQWREQLPAQFIYAGISEQNAINVASGLSASGKKVYIYFMASWVARCFEQIRYSCAIGNNPITILGNGVGLGYAPAGPAHETNEDIAYMRSLLNIEIYSPSNNQIVEKLVELTIKKPMLRYIRLERKHASCMENIYLESMLDRNIEKGISIVSSSKNKLAKKSAALISYGYMLGRCHAAHKMLEKEDFNLTLFDVWKMKPVDSNVISNYLKEYDHIITVEEQTLSGGFGSLIIECLIDESLMKKVTRLGLPEKYFLENGSRDYHIDNSGLSIDDIHKVIKASMLSK